MYTLAFVYCTCEYMCLCARCANVTSLYKCELRRKGRPDITFMETSLFSLVLLSSGRETFVFDGRRDATRLGSVPLGFSLSPMGLLWENSGGKRKRNARKRGLRDTVGYGIAGLCRSINFYWSIFQYLLLFLNVCARARAMNYVITNLCLLFEFWKL